MEQRTAPPSFSWLYWILLLVIALPTLGLGVYLAREMPERGLVLVAAGLLGVVLVLALWPVVRALEATRRATMDAAADTSAATAERLQQISVLLNQISEQQLLSDRAKAVAFREKDREALRRAIYEDMQKQDWEAAMALANDIEASFGYKQEADRFREEINRRWQEVARRAINEQVQVIDRHCRDEQWAQAQQEAQRLLAQYPNDTQVRNLPVEIDNRRQAYKGELLKRWEDAVARKDVEGSIDLLKQLDMYLTPQEAERLQEPARHMFRERLNNLRTQLSLAVQDHKWADAVRLAETIAGEYPNTRVATESAEMLPRLRERAQRDQEQQAVEA